jgi:ubiquinone biosynthesis protein
MFSSLKNIGRLIHIARTLSQNDVLWLFKSAVISKGVIETASIYNKSQAKGRPGERLANALEELGPTFTKFGQALSTRSDLLGEELAKDLSKLQDNLPPFHQTEVRSIIEKELGITIEACFTNFIWQSVAAASIAQVHFAVTTEGEDVAVKILRPNIERAFTRDIALFFWITELLERFRPGLRRLKLREVVEKFEETVKFEMDFRFEAAAAQELAENFASDKEYKVPNVDWRRTSKRVLTMERISGIAIDERDAIIQAGHDPDTILTRAATCLFKQVFRDGFFHADQHPGNLFIGKDGEIIAVDFGIMGRLDKPTRQYLAEMLVSFLNRNYSRVAELHFEAGYVPYDKSVQAFTQACRSIAEPILDKPQNEISIARLLSHLFQVTKTFEMETQPQLLLLQKTMLTAEGVGRTLSPEANMWVLAQPLIKEWVEKNMEPETIILNAMGEMTNGLKRLPTIISNIERNVATIANNGLKLNQNPLKHTSTTHRINKHISGWFYSALIIILITLLYFK